MTIARQPVPITDKTVVDRETTRALGPIMLGLPEGVALCHDALSLTIMTAEARDGSGPFIIVAAAADFDGRHLGALTGLTANQARNFAASLIISADEIDGRKGLS
jgi:hypothetical protein